MDYLIVNIAPHARGPAVTELGVLPGGVDCLTPKSGPHAGQLGPWARVVTALGFDPRSPAIKGLHLGLGVAWLTSATCFALHLSGSTWMLLGCALGILWYVPLGTVLSLVLITILVLSKTGIFP